MANIMTHDTFISICRDLNIDTMRSLDEIKGDLRHTESRLSGDFHHIMNELNSANYAIQYIDNMTEDKKILSKKDNPIQAFVYLIQGENNRCKIGVSKDPKRRLSELKRASSEDHKMLFFYFVDNPYAIEKSLHESFSSMRTHSEWFELNDEDISNIKTTLSNVSRSVS
jgi:hypothetical protein